jgi:hypothetical protein
MGTARFDCFQRRFESDSVPAAHFGVLFRRLFDALFALVARPNSQRDFPAAIR